MTLSALLLFVPIYLLAVMSPGPAAAAVVARALHGGLRRTLPFIVGVMLGDMVWMGAVVLGLSALAQQFAGVFVAIRYAGAAYLLFLAIRLWRAPPSATHAPPETGEGARQILAGLSLTLGNPKAMVFFLAILPNVVDVSGVGALAFAELLGCIVALLGGGMLAYALAAARARRAIADPRAIRLMNRATGGMMAGAAVAIVARA